MEKKTQKAFSKASTTHNGSAGGIHSHNEVQSPSSLFPQSQEQTNCRDTPFFVKRLAILSGGWSGERDISILSGEAMAKTLRKLGKYEVFIIDVKRDLRQLVQDIYAIQPDVILLALHGAGGEDGVIQGILETMEIPYSHSSLVSSAIAMDKVFSNILFQSIGLQPPPWAVFSPEALLDNPSIFPLPYVIKPRNEGSSLGVSLIKNERDVQQALTSWVYDPDVLVQKYIHGKEIETAIFDGQCLGTIEIRPLCPFFDYKAKYTQGCATHVMPAEIPAAVLEKVAHQAEQAFNLLRCHGFARLDFIYGDDDELYILELNTQPGMTDISLVPEIARYAGLSFEDVLEKMIESAIKKTLPKGKTAI
jgi:D-alanine-D-alanine ligase